MNRIFRLRAEFELFNFIHAYILTVQCRLIHISASRTYMHITINDAPRLNGGRHPQLQSQGDVRVDSVVVADVGDNCATSDIETAVKLPSDLLSSRFLKMTAI